ncbi:MAG: DUF4114 domain-containing protein [Cyanobacteria bacterium J06632_22]
MMTSAWTSAEGTLLEAVIVGPVPGDLASLPDSVQRPAVGQQVLDWLPNLDRPDEIDHWVGPTLPLLRSTAPVVDDNLTQFVEAETATAGSSTVSDRIAAAWQLAVQDILATAAQQPDEIAALLGDDALPLVQTLAIHPLNVEPVPIAALMAKGAYAQATETIYLAEEWVAGQSVETIAAVLIEEMGHWLDDRVNAVDTVGDEGALFATLVQGQRISVAERLILQTEDDGAVFVWQGQTLVVEQSGLGEFTVDASGQVSINFVFDNGAYAGELAVFELTGMDAFGVGSAAYIQEAARRALSNTDEGSVVISDVTEGAQRSGNLGEPNQGLGVAAVTRTRAWTAGTRFAFMLVPNGTVQTVFNNPNGGGSLRPLFSLAAANPSGADHLAQVTQNVFTLEDLRVDQGSDRDFNDIVFTLQGATGQAVDIRTVIAPEADWLTTPDGQSLFNLVETPKLPPNLVGTAVTADFVRNSVTLSDDPGLAEGDIPATVPRIEVNGKRIYIGEKNPSGNNKNPVIRAYNTDGSFAWVRSDADYEDGEPDGTGIGLAWTGTQLYAVFTVDGGDGDLNQDFRRNAGSAETSWLRSYGSGGGPKVSVLGIINPDTGELGQTAFLTAILSNGNTNSLLVTNITTNATGNLVVTADSFFTPRQVSGQPFQNKVTTDSSPFTYTVELTPDLKRVVSTFADGWT